MNYIVEAQKIRNFPPPPLPVIQGIINAPKKIELPKTTKVSLGQTKEISILGENFLEDCVLAAIPHEEDNLNDAKILDHKLISSTEIRIIFHGEKEGIFDLLINTDKEVTSRVKRAIEVKFSPWIDFRKGGNEISKNDFKMTKGLELDRDEQGLSFKNKKRHWKWGALYLPLLHSRQEKNSYEFIFYHKAGVHMVGIGKENFNINSNSQIYEAEIAAYLSSPSYLSRFYGNSSSFVASANLSKDKYKKLVLENNGEAGAKYYLYELPSAKKEDWDDISNLKANGKIPEILREEGEKIAPFFLPYSTQQIKYTAVKLS